MADSDIKAMTAQIPAVEFDETSFTTPVRLNEATVAIVTSAALHIPAMKSSQCSILDTEF